MYEDGGFIFNAADGRILCGENLDECELAGIGAALVELVVVLTEFSCDVVLDVSKEKVGGD